ncbi:NAD(P)H-dependent flavin oxidoreductase [Williamsia deligens]|uniref:Propionate 3-nitronate monooxygenase n=1 Tax=Williamsia deligens TaxID=321325 RepID=A0ABW3G487_9NOCA|nr:nitronate monooxygenase [Williamsia deligens]MCP2193815.1 nitronate monooxygenase [Williamsia deligens]
MTRLDELDIPLIGAPMAGGPTTDALVIAVSRAGALGMLATAYRPPEATTASIAAVRDAGVSAFGVNLFVPDEPDLTAGAHDALVAYRELLQQNHPGGEPGPVEVEPHDDYPAILAAVTEAAPPWVSFTFGLPDARDVEALHRRGSSVMITVTTAADARAAEERGADAVWVQGPEAGGHRSTFSVAETPSDTPLDTVLAEVRDSTPLPLVASGGVAQGSDVRRLLDGGATAVGVGTLLLLADEAGTSDAYRAALTDPAFDETVLTRAFSGRVARGLRNRFHDTYASDAPAMFPAVNTLTGPLRRAATAAGDPHGVSLWAGTGHRAVRPGPAADIITELWSQATS